jgi:hypothetical protein
VVPYAQGSRPDYLAIEPYGRPFWPDALRAWTGLWLGRLRDPRVGREMLIGTAFGGLSLLVVEVPKLLSGPLGWRMPQFPFGNALWVLETPSLVGFGLNQISAGLQSAVYVAMVFLVLRRPRAAMAVGVGVLLLIINNGQVVSGTWMERFNAVAFTFLITVVIHRVGLLATATFLFVENVVEGGAVDHRSLGLVVDAHDADRRADGRTRIFLVLRGAGRTAAFRETAHGITGEELWDQSPRPVAARQCPHMVLQELRARD